MFASFIYMAIWTQRKFIWPTPTVIRSYTTFFFPENHYYMVPEMDLGHLYVKKQYLSHQILFWGNNTLCINWKVEKLALTLRDDIDGFLCKAFLKCSFLIMLRP